MYDVVVVGAGPAGSTAAKFCSEKGIKTLLIDKDKFPRDKPCGGGLPAHVLKRFKNIVSEDMIESYSYGGTTYSSSLRYKIEAKSDEPVTAMVIRKKFDHEMVKVAIKHGADFKCEAKVVDIEILNDKATVILDDESRIDTKIIVGADGVWSIVAKKTGLKQKNNPIGLCVVEEYEVEEKIMDKFFGKSREGYLNSKFQNIAGYGWVFPKKKHLNIGLGEIEYNSKNKKKKTNLANIYKDYVSMLKEMKLIPEIIKVSKIKGGALPVFPLKKTYSDRILLVGDAAGFINPITGEGIYYAMVSGQIAAETIQKALAENDASKRSLSIYQKSWKKDFGKDLKLLYWFTKQQRKTKSERNFRIMEKDPTFNQLLVDVMTGDLSIRKNKWKILRKYIVCLIKDIL